MKVVRLELSVAPGLLPELAEELDEGERARAARFVFERDRNRFLAAHGLLRRELGQILGRTPSSLRFLVGKHGKPSLLDEPLEFNLSHSADRALLAVDERPVGVDIEEMRPNVEFREIAERMFAHSERARLGSNRDLAADFYRVWTLKEAFIKAIGEGLSHPLDSFDVDAGINGWKLQSLEIDAGFAAAVAVSAGDGGG